MRVFVIVIVFQISLSVFTWRGYDDVSHLGPVCHRPPPTVIGGPYWSTAG